MTDTQPIRNLKLTLAYDGTDFHGWQVQPTLPTVQGTLAQAIQHITGERVLPQGSGRTDAGVHAEGQVASFPLATPIPDANLLHALNRKLPLSIRILSAETVPADFHARHSARGKTYQYRIFAAALDPARSDPARSDPVRSAICPPTLARYVHVCDLPLSLAAMQHAAQAVIGLHDFTSFAASDPDRQQRECLRQNGQSVPAEGSSGIDLLGPQPVDKELAGNVRTIFSSNWRREGQLLLYTVHGSGFLHHMVRNLVGSFLQAGLSRAGLSGTGLSRMQTPTIEHILAAKDRSVAGPTAPASGLFLLRVDY